MIVLVKRLGEGTSYPLIETRKEYPFGGEQPPEEIVEMFREALKEGCVYFYYGVDHPEAHFSRCRLGEPEPGTVEM